MAWWVPQGLSNFFRITALLAVTVPSSIVIMYTVSCCCPDCSASAEP